MIGSDTAKFLLLLSAVILFSVQGASQITLDPTLSFEELQVYDVTGLSDSEKETGGELLDQGSNKTFLINQSEDWREYRFTFRIGNSGGDWDINESDEMYYEVLDSDWEVNKIWYNASGRTSEGGNFSDRRVNWNLTNGGTLTSDDEMFSKFLVNISLDSSVQLDNIFQVDVNSSSGTSDEHILNLTKLGYLDIGINDPPNDTTLTQNKTFPINTTVNCLDGECGEVDVSARYNQSSAADTLIPEGSGTPFHTNSSNYGNCGNDLKKGDQCTVSWDVNSTGDLESYHLLDANASSSFSEIPENDTEDRLVQINMAVLINLSWGQTDFGVLDPGAENKSASENDNLGYNITVPEESNAVDNLWLRATDLESRLRPENYSIGAENISYSLQNDTSTSSMFSNSYQVLESSISPGTVLNTFYWIDIPFGIYKGEYNGTMHFKANSTR